MEGGLSVGSKSTRTCAFCRRAIPLKAKKCDLCGGVLDPKVMQGMAWRNHPALDGQVEFLYRLGVKVDSYLTRGVASDLIEGVKNNDHQTFADNADFVYTPGKSRKKSPFKIIIILLVLAAIVYVLNRLGVLKPFVKNVKEKGEQSMSTIVEKAKDVTN